MSYISQITLNKLLADAECSPAFTYNNSVFGDPLGNPQVVPILRAAATEKAENLMQE